MAGDERDLDGAHGGKTWSRETLAALVAQLHYDRADVARISRAAAAAMDIVIAEIMGAADKLMTDGGAAKLDKT